MTEEFNPILVSVKELFRGDKIDPDNRNYYIPLYQRKFAWDVDHVEKLINDIKEVADLRDGAEYQTYFIGGIVLSSESIEGPERTKKSLEVIDGQQRLTSIALLLAITNQQLKSEDKNYTYNADFIESISEEIVDLLHTKEMNYDTQKYEKRVKVERADDLKEIYNQILIDFCKDEYIDLNNYFSHINTKDEDLINLRDVVIHINLLLNVYTEKELISFITQLLKYTKLVVTLTINMDTGFLVFEKLNDSGIDLEPQDLLKNYLFRTSNNYEYDDLTIQWKSFLKDVWNINKTKSKMLPREFLENYLISIGSKIDPKKNKRTQVFKMFKELRKDNFSESLDLLLDLKNTAREYKNLKEDPLISYYLNKMNFKLGYLIFLSFYKKYPSEYNSKRLNIMPSVLRLGIVLLITLNSKKLSEKVPLICNRIYNSRMSFDETLNDFSSYISIILEDFQKDFENIVSSTNIFRKKSLTSILLNIINYSLDQNKLGKDITLEQIITQNIELNEEKYPGLTQVNIKVFANLLGNLTILPYPIDKNTIEFSPEEKILHIKKLAPLAINNMSEIKYIDNEFLEFKKIIAIDGGDKWSKDFIEKRSHALTKIAIKILFTENLPFQFIKSDNLKYFITRNSSKHAEMLVLENGYKVIAGSRCKKDHHESWSYGELKKKLLDNKILIDKEDYLEFSKDYIFKTPSEASSIVLGKQSPGPLDWRDINGISFRDK